MDFIKNIRLEENDHKARCSGNFAVVVILGSVMVAMLIPMFWTKHLDSIFVLIFFFWFSSFIEFIFSYRLLKNGLQKNGSVGQSNRNI